MPGKNPRRKRQDREQQRFTLHQQTSGFRFSRFSRRLNLTAVPQCGINGSFRTGVTVEQIMAADQRVVLVTGASSGIGEACARYLSQRGHRVYGFSRRATGTSKTGDNGVIHLSMDVTDDRSVKQAIDLFFNAKDELTLW